MGTLQVGGTTLATKNVSTGKVDLSTNADGGLITMFDQFYLKNHFTTNDSTITPWTRVTASTHSGYSPLNTGLTQNSGIFSFPENGLYLIQAMISVEEFTGSSDNIEVRFRVTTNNSTYKTILSGFDGVTTNPVTGSFSLGPTLINCTSTTDVKFLFYAFSINSGNAIRGSDGDNDSGQETIYTSFSAMRIGPSQ